MVGQFFLDAGHAPFLPAAFDDEIVGRAHEDEEDREPDRGDDQRLDQARAVGDGCDVAKAGRRDRDHSEVNDVEEAHLAIDRIYEAAAVKPVDHHHDEDEQQRKPEPDSEIAPYRNTNRAAQRLELARGDDLFGLCCKHPIGLPLCHSRSLSPRTAAPSTLARYDA